MKRHGDKVVQETRELRKKGYSFAHLQELTGIPATTIRSWCVDEIVSTRWDTLLKTNQKKRQDLKLSEASVIDSLATIDSSTAKIFASLIYWCEGSKYPSSNKLTLTNSDPDLLKVFIELLRKAFHLEETKFSVHLQIHNTHSFDDIQTFWSKLLRIPKSQFIKPTITKPRRGKYRKTYLGTCTLRYSDFKIQLKIIGIYEAFVKKLAVVNI